MSRVDVNATDTLASFRLKVQLPGYRTWWAALDRAPRRARAVCAPPSPPSAGSGTVR